GPELLGRRAVPDRRAGAVPVRHDQAGLVPLEEPPQRMAAGAHPLLRVRAGLHAATGDPDVLPRRPAVRPRPHLHLGARPRRPATDGLRVRPGGHRTGVGAGLPVGRGAAGSGRDRLRGRVMTGLTPSQTVGPFFAIGLPFEAGPYACAED